MNWIYNNWTLVYLSVITVFLLASYSFVQKGIFDERRRSRYRRKTIIRKINYFYEKLYNEEYELFFRRNGLPLWITSQRLNVIRLSIVIVLIFMVVLGMLSHKVYINTFDLCEWGILPIILIPKKPYPVFYIVRFIQKRHINEISNEIYQLYNEIKSNFQVENNGTSNTYYIIRDAIPYYSRIRVTMEKMLPFLEKKKLEEAWSLFDQEINTEEAAMLGIVMKEVEYTGIEQAFLLLEQKRQEFSNHLYNRYTEQLRRKKSIIFSIVAFGFITVLVFESNVFFMWYKEIMSVANRMR